MNKEEYLSNNQGLINKLASKYWINTPKFDYQDLVSVGNQAAIHALDSFNEEKGKGGDKIRNRKKLLSTYVYKAVKRHIRDFVSKEKHDLRVTTYASRQDYEKKQVGEPGTLKNTIALRLSWDDNSSDTKSVDCFSIPSGEPPVDTTMIKKEQVEILLEELNALPKKEQVVIRARYFDGDTLIKIADRMNVSKQCINQIEHRALDKLSRRVILRLDGDFVE